MAKAIMLQGTGSDVGKSVLCTAFCRYFFEEGYRVAPFKSQNMALNSAITADGGEIGRAQGVQAEAAGIEPTVHMNPILLKPKGDMVSEVIVQGRRYADMEAGAYRGSVLEKAWSAVRQSLSILAEAYEVLVIEGAGSPAEINLKDRDIANMRVAKLADAPVILVGDIERGGVFASLVGTLELLDPDERARVKGFIINKFRGKRELLDSGIEWLERRTGIPVLGVVPYLETGVDPEDSLSLESLRLKMPVSREFVDIAVIRLPRISNFTDFLPLADAPDVRLRYVRSAKELGEPDAVILPGTKNTVEDLAWLHASGLAEAIQCLRNQGAEIVGICGGYQMLGLSLHDPDGTESRPGVHPGLGMLDIRTHFIPDKRTVRTSGETLINWARGIIVSGYEIHLGRTERGADAGPVLQWSDGRLDGAVSTDGSVWGTYLHGLFDNGAFTHAWINRLRGKKGLPPRSEEHLGRPEDRDAIYARLAGWIREYVDMERVKQIMGL
ncbi:cobyric acid synthase [Polycladomyces sp. WAk]|uniref:Cobyric acid synthase n=1 Tax=Polycladomyces zharkentensis TaxID=2807616 RepID=A0ABS2WKF2_9BACL|nr:cobyric acid synthase [Polycladomyces sp. WAk]MBN2910037.1 cobyric acid synthase [Polycladomyces sp. WAk]